MSKTIIACVLPAYN